MKKIGIIQSLLFALCTSAIAEEPVVEKTPSLDAILADLPCQQKETPSKRLEALKPYFSLVSPAEVRHSFLAGAIIEAKHPEQKWGSAHEGKQPYKENEAYFWLVANLLYWWCNVRDNVPAVEQVKFMSKQSSILHHMWGKVVANTKLDATRAIGLECLRQDLEAGEIGASFRAYHDWWGEPAKWFDAAESASWGIAARGEVVSIATFSKDDAFKQKVVELFSKDKNEYVRISLESYIKKGLLPAVGEPKKDQGK